MKIEKIKHSYIEGYTIGNFYLIKCYGINTYWWALSKELNYYGGYEGNLAFNKGIIKYAVNCKKGKEILKKLYNNEIIFENLKEIN